MLGKGGQGRAVGIAQYKYDNNVSIVHSMEKEIRDSVPHLLQYKAERSSCLNYSTIYRQKKCIATL